MGVFNGPLLTEAVGVVSEIVIDRVTMPFTFTWPCETSKVFVWRSIVPARFVTDYASIPWAAQKATGWKPNDPDVAQGAVLHDWLTQKRTKLLVSAKTGRVYKEVPISRKECDDIFLDAMTALGAAPFKRNAIYASVRVYATLAFKF